MASGCWSRVNISEVLIKIKEVIISRVMSESSLIKILVLGINDRGSPSF